MTRKQRAEGLQKFLAPHEAALLDGYAHRVLYLNFPSSAGTIFVTKKGRYFLVDFRYIEAAGRIGGGFRVILQEDLEKQLRELAAQDGVTRVVLEDSVSVEELEQAAERFGTGTGVEADSRLSALVRAQQEQKTEEEERQTGEGEAIGGRVLARFRWYLVPGACVRQLRQRLTALRSQEGDESRTFEARFSSGKNGAVLPEDAVPAEGGKLFLSFRVRLGETLVPVEAAFPVPSRPVPVEAGSRAGQLRELVPGDGCAALVTARPDLRYYLCADPGPGAALLVTRRESYLLGAESVRVPGVCSRPAGAEELARLVEQEGISALSVQRSLPVKWFNGLLKILPCRLVADGELEERIYDRRRVKLPEELCRIRQAQDITDRVFLEALNFIREGMTDVEIQRMVGELFYVMGSEMLSYNHVSGCGPDTSLPHVRPSGRTAQRGDFVMLDVGAQVDGYGSDMTRMVGIGQVDEEKKAVYELVLRAQNTAIAAARCGAVCCEVDGAARGVISQAGYGQYFLHGLGHPIGCGGREGPRFNQTDRSVLTAGLVMTVEPGVYLPGKFGVRIEDMVYVGEQGTENLTHSPKELICV